LRARASQARLIADLTAAGAAAEQVEIFSGDPLGGTGALICIGSEEVRVYRVESDDDATEAAARIDPDDPSEIGTAIVEWAGNPRCWQRGTILALYLGKDEDTESLLTEVLRSPFRPWDRTGARTQRGPRTLWRGVTHA
jgi:hypothetical protein